MLKMAELRQFLTELMNKKEEKVNEGENEYNNTE